MREEKEQQQGTRTLPVSASKGQVICACPGQWGIIQLSANEESLWSHRIIGAGYGALQLQRCSRSCTCLLFFPHWHLDTALSHPGAAAKCPAGSSSWWNYSREPQASGYPPSAMLNITDEVMGKTLRLPWYQSTSALQRTPLKISENLIAFCHWIDKCWASRMSSLA